MSIAHCVSRGVRASNIMCLKLQRYRNNNRFCKHMTMWVHVLSLNTRVTIQLILVDQGSMATILGKFVNVDSFL